MDTTITDAPTPNLDSPITATPIPPINPVKSFSTSLERNKRIINRYKEGLRLKDIAIEFGISQVRVSQIVKANSAMIAIDRELEKVRRWRRLKQCELKGSKLIAPKDADQLVRVLEAEMREVEGENKEKLNNSQTVNIQINSINTNDQALLWESARKLLGI